MAVKPTEPETVKRRPGRPRQDRPSDDHLTRRTAIIDTAARLFREKGYEATTLEDVAREVGLRGPSLYHYVPSKAQLLFLVCERALNLAIESLERINRVDDPADRFVAAVRNHATTVARDQAVFKVFFDERHALGPKHAAAIRRLDRRYFKETMALVKATMDAGLLPAVDLRHGTLAVIGLTSWVYKWFDGTREDPDAYAEACVAMLLAPRPAGPPGT